MKFKDLLQWGVMALIAACAVYYVWPNDLKHVERRTKAMFSSLSKNGPENLALASARVLEAVSYIATDADIVPGYPSDRKFSKSETTSLIQQARMRSDKLVVTGRGHDLARIREDVIQVDLTVEADILYQGSAEEHIGTYRLIWEKRENEWLITKIEPLEIIRHPSGSLPSF